MNYYYIVSNLSGAGAVLCLDDGVPGVEFYPIGDIVCSVLSDIPVIPLSTVLTWLLERCRNIDTIRHTTGHTTRATTARPTHTTTGGAQG